MQITDAANRLQVSEYELFHLAADCWQDPHNPPRPDRDYGAYLKRGTCSGPVPVYVNHYIRHLSELEA